MKKFILFLIIISLSTPLYANWLEDIWRSSLRLEKLQGGILDKQGQMLDVQRGILSSQKDIESLMRDVNRSVTGNSGWGTYQFHDYQSYGDSANDWANVMRMAENGRGEGELGQMMGDLSSQFPADRSVFNRSVQQDKQQKYYALQTQTILAARAASHLDYNKVQDQIQYQRMLQQQIEKTKDLKAAVDLNNRIQVEGNLINLEILRQVALANQQQAVTEQATVNVALSNAKFLTKEGVE
jgi:hypothetical protein